MRAEAQGKAWVDATKFADVFRGARVYVYACDTTGTRMAEDVESLGARVVEAGVRLFVGHCGRATAAVETESRDLDEAIRLALLEVLQAFVAGEDDAGELRLVAERSFDIVEQGFLGTSGVPFAIRSMMQSLRTLRRPG